ncbi:M48 family metalloprotease [Psychrobacter aestuarii]|uniref:Putative beta-barrel assembly-enhancing protease n=1 Tax=Psychrobacter aestuarii TaxID=556327 RepID=A0ABP3FA57_9GAMM|nr:M48 family metalloprotease [Psychrobacter aestuarii]
MIAYHTKGFRTVLRPVARAALLLTAASACTIVSAETRAWQPWQMPEDNSLRVPSLQGDGLSFADRRQNQVMGEWALRTINGHTKMLHDPWVQEVITNMTWRLNSEVRQQAPLATVIIDNPNINAFAAPGGVIGINTGTILAADSMDELASVIAHEVAHVSQRHYEHGDDARRQAMLMQIGGMLAAIAASAVDGDAAAAVMMGSQTAAMNNAMAFSRSNEREADRIGMDIMTQAGYDPRAMPRFFAKMSQNSELNQVKNQFLPSFVRSHPQSTERLSDAQSRAQQYPSASLSQQARHQVLFDMLYWRVQQLGSEASKTALTTAANNSTGAKMALMLWHAEHQDFAAANELYQSLKAKAATQSELEPLLSISYAEVLSEQQQWDKAAELLSVQQRTYPERRDLRLYLAEALIETSRVNEASALLKPLIQAKPTDRAAWQALQRVHEKIAKTTSDAALANIATINALRYRSHDQLWSGRYDAALVSLTQAQRLATAASNTKSLLPIINQDIKNVKTAKDYQP